jgi:hypothetical protein
VIKVRTSSADGGSMAWIIERERDFLVRWCDADTSGTIDAAAQRARQEVGLKITLDIGSCWYQPANPRARR